MRALITALPIAILCGCTSPVPSNHFKGAIGGVPFEFDTKKQTTAENIEFVVVSAGAFSTNYSTLKIGKLSGQNDPQVISKSYAGQAAVTKEFFNGINEFASKVVEGGVKGASPAP